MSKCCMYARTKRDVSLVERYRFARNYLYIWISYIFYAHVFTDMRLIGIGKFSIVSQQKISLDQWIPQFKIGK